MVRRLLLFRKILSNERILLLFIILIGMSVRLWRFGQVPTGIFPDEAFSGYQAWSLLHYGVDNFLKPWPIYFIAGGSGMNALQSYLLIPLIALFGTHTWVVRIPQLLIGIASIPAAFQVGKHLGGKTMGLILAGFLSIAPWHVMMSRWGLESNLAPGMILIGLAFYLNGLEKSVYLVLSALFWGFALYSYAMIWPVFALFVLLTLVATRPKMDFWLLLAGVILFLLALPPLCFLLVNYGVLPEFALFGFTIPKLPVFRGDDVSLTMIGENLTNLGRILFFQTDGLPWNSLDRYGMIYLFGLPFALLGTSDLVFRVFGGKQEGKTDETERRTATVLLIWLFCGLIQGAIVHVNINRGNFLMMALVLMAGVGIKTLAGRFPRTRLALALIFALSFTAFITEYFGLLPGEDAPSYNRNIAKLFTEGIEEVMLAANDEPGKVFVPINVQYPSVLFFSGVSPYQFNETIEYVEFPAPYLSAKTFDRYSFVKDLSVPPEEGTVLLWFSTPIGQYSDAGYRLTPYGMFYLAVRGNF